jgi:ribonuclease Z
MTPLFHPRLVNGPFGDPALYVGFLHEKRALLFDLGDVGALAPRHLLRLTEVFVSHTHMDHFVGFDRLVRVRLGRGGVVRLFGPPGFCDRVEAKLRAYTWNLVERYDTDFTLLATELDPDGRYRSARFRCKAAFAREDGWDGVARDGLLVDDPAFRVWALHLDHKIPSLAFRLEERAHVNVHKSRLDEMGLPTGPWLQDLKRAVLTGRTDDTPVTARWKDAEGEHARGFTLGELKARVLSVVPGQHLVYVVDAAPTPENAQRITAFAKGADRLYIEAAFLSEHAARARETCHLTAALAGRIGRDAGVGQIVPFHFSTRYGGMGETPLVAEAEAAFAERIG